MPAGFGASRTDRRSTESGPCLRVAVKHGPAASNLVKHGVSFTAAVRALEDPRKIEFIDDRFDYGEDRVCFGLK